MPEGPLAPSTRRIAVLLLAYTALSALTRAVLAGADVINVDEASYMVGARELFAGRLPYTAFGDNKPPLIYVYYGLAQMLAGHGIAGVRLFTTLVTVPATALAVSGFYRHTRTGIVAAALFLCYSAAYTASDMLAVNCEVVMMLPLAWSLVALRDYGDTRRPERALLAGTLIGAAALVKYQAALWLPAVAITIAETELRHVQRFGVRPLLALTLGAAIPTLMTVAVFGVAGGLDGLFYWNVTHNVEYLQNPVTLSQAIVQGARQLLPFLAVTSCLWYGAYRSWAVSTDVQGRMLFPCVLASTAVAVTLGWRFFPHYFVQFYVPLAVAAAPWMASLAVPRSRIVACGLAAATVALVCTWTVVNAGRIHTRTVHELNGTASRVADHLRRDPCYSGGTMFVWGSAPEFYYKAGLSLASRYFFPEFPLVRYYAGNVNATAKPAAGRRRVRRMRHWSRLMADLRASRATYIVDTAPASIARWDRFPTRDYPGLHDFIQRRYRRIATIDAVDIYRRIGCELPAVLTADGSLAAP